MEQLATHEHKLTLTELLGMLVADGLISQAAADAMIAERRGQRQNVHPLTAIAGQNWKSLLPPHKALHQDALTEWLAGRVGLEYFHIDPLKIDFSIVTDIMSNDYATRFGILPVQVTPKEVVIATCRTLPARLGKRAQAHPAQEHPPRRRLSGRHQPLPGRVLQSGALGEECGTDQTPGKIRTSLVRAAGGDGQDQPAVRRQRPAHRHHRRLAVAVRFRAARFGHPHRTAARHRASCASASTACCIRFTRSRCR